MAELERRLEKYRAEESGALATERLLRFLAMSRGRDCQPQALSISSESEIEASFNLLYMPGNPRKQPL